MNSDAIYQGKSFDSIDGSLLMDENVKHVLSFAVTEKTKDETDTLTSRVTFIDDVISENPSKKSFLLYRKHYPNYHHFSHNTGTLKRFPKLTDTHLILPQIKGRTLSRSEAEAALSKKIHGDITHQITTMQDLTNSILRYGGKTDVVWMKFPNNRNGQKLVRPGFSARRYMANLVRYLNDDLVDKLISEGRLLEKTLFRNSILLPHIRRRISADLSRYPEPYRILKQMLIAPGPLNEFSFVWRRASYVSEPESFDEVPEMKIGDIKILSKKKDSTDSEPYEEVKYDALTHDKKKTVLTNLLLKSAINHALNMKDEIIEHNSQTKDTKKEPKQNLHIPVMKFNMMEAVTDLLNKETFETLSTKLAPSLVREGFRGQALRASTNKEYKMESKLHLEDKDEHMQVIDVGQIQHEKHLNPAEEVNVMPHLTLRLHQTNVTKGNYKKKTSKVESSSDKQSSVSSNVLAFNPLDQGLPDFQSQKEAQANAFVERLKNKPLKDIKVPYGKYRESEESEQNSDINQIGDLDPTLSFKTWKYDDPKHSSSESPKVSSNANYGSDSQAYIRSTPRLAGKDKLMGHDTKMDDEHMDLQADQNRLILLLSEHAETVAEKVLKSSGGGEDFASDVNAAVIQWNDILKERYFEIFNYVAIMEILKQKNSLINESNRGDGQIWNVDVENMKNQEEYGDMIKTIFKSVFNDQLGGVSSNDMNISPEIMALLQDGSKLSLDDIKVETDPITGQSIIRLKEGISTRTEIDSLTNLDKANMPSKVLEGSEDHFKENIRTSKAYPSHKDENNVVSTLDDKREPRVYQLDQESSGTPFGNQLNVVVPSGEQSTQNWNSKIDSLGLLNRPLSPTIYKDAKIKENGKHVDGEDTIKGYNERISPSKDTNEMLPTASKKKSKKANKIQSRPDFVIAHVEDSKDINYLHSPPSDKSASVKLMDQPSQKTSSKQNKQKSKKLKSKQENEVNKIKKTGKHEEGKEISVIHGQAGDPVAMIEKEDKDTRPDEELEDVDRDSRESLVDDDEDQNILPISDDNISDYDGDDEEKKLLIRQQREAKRKADAAKRRLEVDFRRKEKEEKRKMENKRREMEEILKKKLDDERRQREEEYKLRMEKERAEELLRLEALEGQEYLRQKQIEKERREKEEFRRKLEEMKMKQAMEEERKRLEQELLALEEAERLRLENEMLSRMQEKDRQDYLRRKAEEEESIRIKEEEERRLREEQAQFALDEARRIAQQQAKERAILEARLNFVKGIKIENEGLKKYLNVTPSFVWSYFEFLRILGIETNSTTNQ